MATNFHSTQLMQVTNYDQHVHRKIGITVIHQILESSQRVQKYKYWIILFYRCETTS